MNSDDTVSSPPEPSHQATSLRAPVATTSTSSGQTLGASTAVTDSNGIYYAYGGIALAVIALFTGGLAPFVALIAIALGYFGRKNGVERPATIAMVLGGIVFLLGLFL